VGALSTTATPLLDVGVAGRALESESGDACTVEPFDGGVLVAVVDGTGHGPEAAHAARIAIDAIAGNGAQNLPWLAAHCHERLRGTRGVVAALASVCADGTVTWAGVGNVEGIVVDRRSGRPRELLMSQAGVLGETLPPLHPRGPVRVVAGDTLVFATDGVEVAALTDLDRDAPPQANADRILAAGCKPTDDALVLVARYGGERP
jgi:hypothetical protein